MKSGKNLKRSPVKIVIFAVLAVLFAAAVWSILRKDRETTQEFLAPVITINPVLGSIEKTIHISSQVETGRLITLVPRVAGTLVFLDANPGAQVTADQLLARIDSAPYDLTFLQAKAAYTTSKSTYDRINGLYQNQAATRQNFEEARAAYEAAKAQFELAELNLDYTNVRAPMDGIVLMRHGTEGGLVDTGMPLVTIGDLGDLRIKAAVPEIHYRFFAENWESMEVRLTVRALEGETFILEPLSLAPYISPENRSFLVEYVIPEGAERGLRPGMFANVSFILERREDVYYLPFRVLGSRDRLWYADENGEAQFVQYSPAFFNEDVFEIPRELSRRSYILEGQHFITPGQKLNILSENPGVSVQ
ncbi:efflux RND transporter periplasmic adaptor subunit [Breznakiella homolactica]|uniref:Efflux RND transporter periplasmic adaptor subunit n=1 Tax=Breznakiella homolactica TaxID=2798577 RepID=A0A7T7XPL4_9SPIR|nr:efflux RND transporter periplasmic adaptor subunit [Breznakiella homolactica]QQO10122.1 efflux RND transporter periplasmic adaptor subunit [Breznakiella homolactica]